VHQSNPFFLRLSLKLGVLFIQCVCQCEDSPRISVLTLDTLKYWVVKFVTGLSLFNHGVCHLRKVHWE
jgi:hypothetical protein